MKYETPDMKISVYQEDDIITTSDGLIEDDDPNIDQEEGYPFL